MDRWTPKTRSALMRKVRVKDTAPEMIVRRVLHRLGYRFRLHRKDLPGTPDIVLPSRRKIVLVNGCFWHGHSCRKGALPKSRVDSWAAKITANRLRDRRTVLELERQGWHVLTIWECEAGDSAYLEARLLAFLSD